ncbi:MAG: excinuclease ABC subunit UvrC [Patescibacteria group bacterium]
MLINTKKIPNSPGIYYFLNKANEIIYIGKAKNLRSRIASYWQKTTELTEYKQQMLAKIAHIRYTLVDNETESLLLEASQIKKYQPKYNIVLKDDKNWGYIVVTNEIFPRIIITHGRQKRRGQYFGPYTSTLSARTMVRLLHRLFSLYTKNSDLVKKNGQVFLKEKFGGLDTNQQLISQTEYQKTILTAKKIISGQTKELSAALRSQILAVSAKQNYELAQIKKQQLEALEKIGQKQKVISSPRLNQDVLALAQTPEQAVITAMQIRRGILGDKLNFFIKNPLHLSSEEILTDFINQFYSQRIDIPAKIILPASISRKNIILAKKIKLLVPNGGKNLALLKLVQKNAQDYLAKNIGRGAEQKLLELQKLLSTSHYPQRIEIYDISNIQGSFAVGAMVVFTAGQIDAAQYRLFKIKNTAGPDDPHMLAEVLLRRSRHHEWPEPDLIILDGGKPQLNTVLQILPLTWKNRTISLAKKQEEIFLPGKKSPLTLSSRDPLSLFIQNMRNQAHKFAIKNYRKLHRKAI